MSGNVAEWCSDWFGEDYYTKSRRRNPRGPSSGSERVLRGGSLNSPADFCYVARRFYNDPSVRYVTYGFRVVLSQ